MYVFLVGTVSFILIMAIILTVGTSFYQTFVNLPNDLKASMLSKKKLAECKVNPLTKVSQPDNASCQLHYKSLTIYMDSFKWLDEIWMSHLYTTYKKVSETCPRLPGGGRCTFVSDERCADGIMFNGAHSDLNFIKQHPDQIVIAFTMEPEGGPDVFFPVNYQYDIKVSFLRSSNIPIPFICERDRALQLANMGQPQLPKNRSGIVAMISNCRVKWRNEYVTELMKYIEIKLVGGCHRKSRFSRTRRLPDWEDKKLEFLKKSKFKFLLTFENIIETDYITEKVYDALLTHTVPIYYGDSAVFDLIPGNHTIIYARDYTPKQLADYIKKIDNDEEMYSNFFKNWDLEKMSKLHKMYCYDHFMCRICKKALEVRYHQEGCVNMKLMDRADH